MGVELPSKSKHSRAWGMGFLLVFFSDEQDDESKLFLSSTNSSLLHKAQSTVSICLLLLLFTTLLLFTLSPPPSAAPRRLLREPLPPPSVLPHALQGMGTLYRRGTGAMNDVVLAHTHGSLSPNDLKLFLRLFLRSPLASKSDLLLVFPAKTAHLDGLILREQKSFADLLNRYQSINDSSSSRSASGFEFDITHFTRNEGETGEPIWGPKTRSNFSQSENSNSNRPIYGSVVGFDADELDPGNSLSGFLDHVPMNFRRWACYPMLLGRVRQYYKHVALVDIEDFLLLGDPLSRVRNHSHEFVLLSKHGRRNSVHSGIIIGGARGVRRLSSAMLMDIVRSSTIQRKKMKSLFSESGVFNHLVGNDRALKNVNLVVSTELLPEVSRKSGSHLLEMSSGLIVRGNSDVNAVNSVVMKHICSFAIDSIVYRDCP